MTRLKRQSHSEPQTIHIFFFLFLTSTHLLQSVGGEAAITTSFPQSQQQFRVETPLPNLNWGDFYEIFHAQKLQQQFNDYSSPILKLSADPREPHLLYVATVNNIFLLDTQLRIKGRLVTGPQWDNQDCLSAENLPSESFYFSYPNIFHSSFKQLCLDAKGREKETTHVFDSRIEVLLPYTTHTGFIGLVLCGNLRRGSCYFYQVLRRGSSYDIVKDTTHTYKTSNNTFLSDEHGVAYVAALDDGVKRLWTFGCRNTSRREWDWNNDYQRYLGVSRRILPQQRGSWKSEEVQVMAKRRETCRLYSVLKGTFDHSGFLYFVSFFPFDVPTREMKDCFTNAKSTINVMCMADESLSSIIEASLQCQGVAGKGNSEVLASSKVTAGEYLSSTTSDMHVCEKSGKDVATGEALLAAVFKHQSTVALCLYPLEAIKSALYASMQGCWSRQGFLNAQFSRRESLPCLFKTTVTNTIPVRDQRVLLLIYTCFLNLIFLY